MCLVKFLTEGKIVNVGEVFEGITPQTHHVDSTLKRRGNGRFHGVSTWNPRGVFVGLLEGIQQVLSFTRSITSFFFV